jgi:hypothetical protein
MINPAVDNYTLDIKATRFLDSARNSLSFNEFSILSQILTELYRKSSTQSSLKFLHILCFNVRGIDLRWGEVCLLAAAHRFDIMILGEVGRLDLSLIGAAFPNYQVFYQIGENAHGGILVLVRMGIPTSRVNCSIPNICTIDLHLEEPIRIVAIYAPESKSWEWSDISGLIASRSVIMGDFNVDLEKDGDKAERLLEWMDSYFLVPTVPDSNTSLRSNRIIDYALSAGVDITVQSYEGGTTSDHKPLFCVLTCEGKENKEGCKTMWTIFSFFLTYTFDFWEKQWSYGCYDGTYEHFTTFLSLLAARCTSYFPLKKARSAVPLELRSLLAQSRTLSFKAKRKGDVGLRREAHRLRNIARYKLRQFQQDQLAKQLNERHAPGEGSTLFWSKTKRHFRTTSSSLRGLLLPNGESTKDPQTMANTAAEYYERLFAAPEVIRPHPYIDIPAPHWDNAHDLIPNVTYPEVLKVLATRKKKRSCDIHGLSSFMLEQIPRHYWHILVHLYNHSFATCFLPKKFKEVRMVLLAKKDAICPTDQTRPISLLDSFLKVQERLFLNRFLQVLKDRGILPDNQSGFRAGHRLQTRVLLLIEQISSYMSNSSPVATVFVDFKSAFDQLWFEGCLGKLIRLGIPLAYVNWIQAWLEGRRGVIEIQGKRSRWFPIQRGGPQGSSFTPTLFITYHCDMADFIPMAMSFFFADDLAAVVAGQIGARFTDQCLDLERRLGTMMEHLEFYSILAVQPINYSKTQAMFSARAINYPNPMPVLRCGSYTIEWVSSFKYLGYWLTSKLGWGNIIGRTRLRIRQQTGLVNSIRFGGNSSTAMRRVLFSTFVLPFFTWLFALYPLFTICQQSGFDHFYYTCLKRVLRCNYWEDFFFASAYDERTLGDRCYTYWEKYCKTLTKSLDGRQLVEQSLLNAHRTRWQEGDSRIRSLRRSKRFVPHLDVFALATRWMAWHGTGDSVVSLDKKEFLCFAEYPESF